MWCRPDRPGAIESLLIDNRQHAAVSVTVLKPTPEQFQLYSATPTILRFGLTDKILSVTPLGRYLITL